MNPSPSQIEVLQHTLGLTPKQREPYRNHYVASGDHYAMPDLQSLESMGLMARGRTPAFCDPSDIVFMATERGRALALERLPDPPKLTRYDEWLRAECNESFGEYLCGWRLPKLESRYDYRQINGRWRYVYRYRMFREAWDGVYGRHNDVEGVGASTKKDAKASYKAALRSYNAAKQQVTL